MSGRAPRIGLFGLFGVHNLGNEATLAATIAALRERIPDVELTLVSSPLRADAGLPTYPTIEPDLAPMLYRPWRLVPWRWKRAFGGLVQRITEPLRRRRTRRAAASLDMLLIAGTGIADDFGQGPLDAPHHMARWCEVVRGMGGYVCFASIGAGPASHPLSRRWFGDALRAANYRSYREYSSQKFAIEIGVDAAADPVLPDLVFSLPVDPERASRPVQWPPRSIGLGVMGYSGWNVEGAAAEANYSRYLTRIEWLARQLLDAGYRLHLLIGNRGGDRRPVADLRAALADHPAAAAGALVASDIHTHEDVMAEIAATDLVVATRFHNVLKALRLGRPVISIGYASKNDDLMRAMGLGEYCHGVDDFDPARVLAQVRDMAALPAPPTETARAQVAKYQQALAAQFDQIAASAVRLKTGSDG